MRDRCRAESAQRAKRLCCGIAVAVALCAPRAIAQPLVVAGSPGYDSAAGSGFKFNPAITVAAIAVNDSGVAVAGYGDKYVAGKDVGERAVRWDPSGSGAAELESIGADPSANTFVAALNNSGTAVGWSFKHVSSAISGPVVRWDGAGTVTELGNVGTDPTGVTTGSAAAINSSGLAVGYLEKYVSGVDRGERAVRWAASTTNATELGVLSTNASGYTIASADAVNDLGTAVGLCERYVGSTDIGSRATRWNASGTAATELGNLGIGPDGYAYAEALKINSSGIAVGYAGKYVSGNDLGSRAVRWAASGTAATELGNLGTRFDGYMNASAYDVNDVGTTVGEAEKYTDAGISLGYRAVRWDAAGTAATELGNLGTDESGYTYSVARAVNNAGVAVGSADKYVDGAFVATSATMWGLDGVAIGLNDLGVVANPSDGTWELTEADAISDTGWIAGLGMFTPKGGTAYQRAWVAHVNLAEMLPGDYNGNGIVDAADYTVWRDQLGQNYTLPNRDPNASGPIGADDYAYWVAHFGQGGSGAASARTSAVPEPSELLLALTGSIGCSWLRRTRDVRS
jgi:hypothetical protein